MNFVRGKKIFLICKGCEKKFNSYQAFGSHNKKFHNGIKGNYAKEEVVVDDKSNDSEILILNLKNQLEELKKELQKKKDEDAVRVSSGEQMIRVSKLAESKLSRLERLSGNAEALEVNSFDDAIDILANDVGKTHYKVQKDDGDYENVESIYLKNLGKYIALHNNSKLHNYIANKISQKFYALPENKRPFWLTDSARLRFAINKKIGSVKKWIIDADGDFIMDTLVTPVLKVIRKCLLTSFYKHGNLIDQTLNDDPENFNDVDSTYDYEGCVNVLDSISSEKFKNKILKALGANFFLDF